VEALLLRSAGVDDGRVEDLPEPSIGASAIVVAVAAGTMGYYLLHTVIAALVAAIGGRDCCQ